MSDILRGAWLLDPSAAREYSRLADRYLAGEKIAQVIDRPELMASLGENKLAGSPALPQKKIARIAMSGVLPAQGDWCMLGADDYLEIFRMLNDDNSVGAVLVNMDVCGSSVAAINYMREFATEKVKPFVFLCNSAYSGGYWTAALLADHIMAYGDLSSGFGSIGVLCTVVDDREKMKNEGRSVQIIRAPQSTDKAQQMVDFYAGNDEAFVKSLQEEMRPMAEAFFSDVRQCRPGLDSKAENIFTGTTFNANEALKLGLIDSIGNEKLALDRCRMLIELNS